MNTITVNAAEFSDIDALCAELKHHAGVGNLVILAPFGFTIEPSGCWRACDLLRAGHKFRYLGHGKHVRSAWERARTQGVAVKNGKLLSHQEEGIAANRKAEGASVRQIAREFGVSRGAIHRALKSAGARVGPTEPRPDGV